MSFVHNTRLAFLLLLLSAVSGLAQQADAWAAKIQRIEQMVLARVGIGHRDGIATRLGRIRPRRFGDTTRLPGVHDPS